MGRIAVSRALFGDVNPCSLLTVAHVQTISIRPCHVILFRQWRGSRPYFDVSKARSSNYCHTACARDLQVVGSKVHTLESFEVQQDEKVVCLYRWCKLKHWSRATWQTGLLATRDMAHGLFSHNHRATLISTTTILLFNLQSVSHELWRKEI